MQSNTQSIEENLASNQRNKRNRNTYPASNASTEGNASTSIVVRNQINIINNGTNVTGGAGAGAHVQNFAHQALDQVARQTNPQPHVVSSNPSKKTNNRQKSLPQTNVVNSSNNFYAAGANKSINA